MKKERKKEEEGRRTRGRGLTYRIVRNNPTRERESERITKIFQDAHIQSH